MWVRILLTSAHRVRAHGYDRASMQVVGEDICKSYTSLSLCVIFSVFGLFSNHEGPYAPERLRSERASTS